MGACLERARTVTCYDGNGIFDLAMYANDGRWFIRNLAGDVLE